MYYIVLVYMIHNVWGWLQLFANNQSVSKIFNHKWLCYFFYFQFWQMKTMSTKFLFSYIDTFIFKCDLCNLCKASFVIYQSENVFYTKVEIKCLSLDICWFILYLLLYCFKDLDFDIHVKPDEQDRILYLL